MPERRRLPGPFEGQSRALLVAIGGVGLAQGLLTLALPLVVARAFDVLVSSSGPDVVSTTSVAAPVTALCGLALLAFGARYGERTLSERLGQSYVHRVRLRLWDQLLDLPADEVTGQRRAGTMLRFIGDLNALKSWIGRGLVASLVAVLSLLGGLGGLTLIHPRLGLAATVLVLISLGLQAHGSRRLAAEVTELRRARSRLAGELMSHLGALRLIQSSNQRRRERRRLARRSRRVADAANRAARASGALLGSGELVAVVMVGFILLLGAHELRAGAVTSGGLVAGLVLARYLGRPVRRLSRAQEQYQRARISRRKLDDFLSLGTLEEPDRAKRLKQGAGTLKLKKVSCGTTLRRLSARAGAGERVHLRGVNGAGKSTLLRLLTGLDRPTGGTLVLDGRDLSRCRLRAVRSAVSLVSTDLPLVAGSLRRNLTFEDPEATEEAIWQALRAVELDHFVEALPRGLDTRFRGEGVDLSTGQARRVQIARALLAAPRVLLLDEADAGLDGRGLACLRRIVAEFPGTVIFVWAGEDPPAATTHWTLDAGRLTVERPSKAAPVERAAVEREDLVAGCEGYA